MVHDKCHILLVEDDPTLADVTAFRLELLGYEVTMMHEVEQATAWLAETLPNVVLLDLAVNGNQGIDLLNRLSNDERTSEIPVMVFSTSSDLDDVQRAYTAGAAEFLVTPYDPANLESKIERMAEKG